MRASRDAQFFSLRLRPLCTKEAGGQFLSIHYKYIYIYHLYKLFCIAFRRNSADGQYGRLMFLFFWGTFWIIHPIVSSLIQTLFLFRECTASSHRVEFSEDYVLKQFISEIMIEYSQGVLSAFFLGKAKQSDKHWIRRNNAKDELNFCQRNRHGRRKRDEPFNIQIIKYVCTRKAWKYLFHFTVSIE